MKRFNLHIVVAAIALLLCACINNGPSAQVNDLHLNGIRDRQLLLDGTEGSSTTFSLTANYDWKIIDYKGFSCKPSSGTKTSTGEIVTITATPLQSNNTGDTVRLSALNFKLLSTRFVGISAYQLPRIIAEKRIVEIDATEGSTASFTFKTKCSIDDIELTIDNEELSAKITKSEKVGDYTNHTVIITSLSNNISTDNLLLGRVGFKVDGAIQKKLYIDIIQRAAMSFDRNIVLLPGRSGSENIFVVDSKYEIVTTANSDKFTITPDENNTYIVRSLVDNDTTEQVLLGEVHVSLKDFPESKISIEVHQRKATASQTIMVYFVGTSLGDFYSTNALKMLETLNKDIQGDARLLITFTDSSSDATLYELRYDNSLKKAVKEKVREVELEMPYDSKTFEANIRRMKEFAPAEKYALVIGSHGHGWTPKNFTTSESTLRRFGMTLPPMLWQRPEGALTRYIGDNGYTVQYDVSEITTAIKANDISLEYILFDACFMGNIETAYELRDVTKYIIGSPCEIMGAGFPYSKVLPHMLTEGGKSYDLDKICSNYVEHYRNAAGIAVRSACIGVTHTAELESLAAIVKRMNSTERKEGFSLSNVQYYDGISSFHNPEHIFYDFDDFVEQSCADEKLVEEFKTQLAKTVTSLYHTDTFYSAYDSKSHPINHYSGTTTSADVNYCCVEWRYTAWYKATH